MTPRSERRALRSNVSGINFDRQDQTPRKPGFLGRMVAIILTLLGLILVAFLLFNPVRTRPSAAQYIESFNRIAAAQQLSERMDPAPHGPGAGSRSSVPGESGLVFTVRWDDSGYVTTLELADDPARQPSDGWLRLSPQALRDRILLTLGALDPNWSVVSLYRTFNEMGIDLDQPFASQPAGRREQSADALMLVLTHDDQHVRFEVALDVLEE